MILLLALACTSDTNPDTADTSAPAVDPLSWDLAVAGPYNVGFRSWPITYTPAPGMEPRTVLFQIWYPTEDTDGEAVFYSAGFPDTGTVAPVAWADASLAPSPWGATYPVHAYSHGYQGYGGSSAFLMRHFASHGWIGVAVDHTNNTLMDHRDPMPTAVYVARPRDISAALDTLEALPDGDPLQGLADTSKVLLSGHSFGNYTTWAAAGARYDNAAARCDAGQVATGTCTQAERDAFAAGSDDPRVVATIPMAGTIDRGWFGDEGPAQAGVPVLAMSGTNDQIGQREQFDAMQGVDFTWIDLEGGCHQAFALGGCGNLPTDEGFAIVDTYAMAFARLKVLGADDSRARAILDGSEAVSERVAWAHKDP